MISVPGCTVNSYLQAIETAEELAGQPANFGEIQAVLVHMNSIYAPVKKGPGASFFLWNLVREDLIYCKSPHFNRFSMRKQEGFRSFSEFCADHHEGYAIDAST
jgi:hypothetical protein